MRMMASYHKGSFFFALCSIFTAIFQTNTITNLLIRPTANNNQSIKTATLYAGKAKHAERLGLP